MGDYALRGLVVVAQPYYWCQYQTVNTDFPTAAAGNASGQLVVNSVASLEWTFTIGLRL